MQVNKFIIAGAVVLTTAVAVLSCRKETGKEASSEQTSFNNTATIQVYNASIPNAATDPRRVYVYVDSKPVTGQSLIFGAAFPASSTGFGIPAGFSPFLIKDTLSASLQPQIAFGENFQANKSYTIFLYDTFTVAKQKTIETNIVVPTDTTARLRFANFIYNPTAVAGIDIFSKKRNAFVATNLLVTQVTDFIPYASASSDSLIVSENGNPGNLLDTLVFNPTRKRSYTLVFRGRWKVNEALVTATAASPNFRALAVFPNN